MPHFTSTFAEFELLPGETTRWIDRSRGRLNSDGSTMDSLVVSDGEPGPDFRNRHASSDLWVIRRRACPLGLATPLVGVKPRASVPDGIPGFATHLFSVNVRADHHFFVLSEPWMPRAANMRTYDLEEVTQQPARISQAEEKLAAFYARVNPTLDSPLVDYDFYANELQAENRYAFKRGTKAEFDRALGDVFRYFLMRLEYPDIPHTYSFILEIDRDGFPAISGKVETKHETSTFWRDVWDLEARIGKARLRLAAQCLNKAVRSVYDEFGAEVTRQGFECGPGHVIYRSNWVESRLPRSFPVATSGLALSGHEVIALSERFAAFFDDNL